MTIKLFIIQFRHARSPRTAARLVWFAASQLVRERLFRWPVPGRQRWRDAIRETAGYADAEGRRLRIHEKRRLRLANQALGRGNFVADWREYRRRILLARKLVAGMRERGALPPARTRQ